MGSLRLSIPLDPFDSKRFHFSVSRTCKIGSPFSVGKIRVAEAIDSHSSLENDSASGGGRRSWSSQLKGGNSVTSGNKRGIKKDVAQKFTFRRESNDLALDEGLFVVSNGEMDVNYSAIKPVTLMPSSSLTG
ncbi:hypothetical protein Bca52824_094583 [Brassica carinata]|uniref:Uncharacterized protein n=1 Tax=Brassica carinata TaxID=52824 RepID=A0A8X7TIU5_BRACI|nr:hypothetical protein Bca52824_094583 [Brassica carinata]